MGIVFGLVLGFIGAIALFLFEALSQLSSF